MSFHDWELSGGLDPYAEPDPEDETSPCGCGDPRCRIDGNDATNVNVKGIWFNADCVGLCIHCGETDDLRHLYRLMSGWLSHEGCAKHDQAHAEGLERERILDERDGK